MDRRRLVIGADSEWETFWREFTGALVPQPNPPAVNFETQMVIAATMGQRTSGGYSISIEQVAKKDGTLYAAVRETSPDATCSNIAVMTAPAVAVVVPRHDGDFAFVESEETLACDP